MTHFKVDAIEVEHAPVTWQGAAPPSFKLFGQSVIEPTDGTGAGRDSQERLSHFSDFVGAGPDFQTFGSRPLPLALRTGYSDQRAGCETCLPDLGALSGPGSDPSWSPDHADSCRCGSLCGRRYSLPIRLPQTASVRRLWFLP